MHHHILAAAVLLAALTAFAAPAPFLARPGGRPSAAALDGLWEITPRGPVLKGKAGLAITNILIEPGKWTFQSRTPAGEIGKRTPYFLKVDTNARPATFDLRKVEAAPLPYGKGVFALDGDELRVAYRFSGDRPTALDQEGTPRVIRFTLRRVRK